MEIFTHHIYEYKKGLRDLILYTTNKEFKPLIEKRLKKEGIDYKIDLINDKNINVYFGHSLCIEIINSFEKSKLNEFTKQEDFILGILLGYSKILQCERYLKKSSFENKINKVS